MKPTNRYNRAYSITTAFLASMMTFSTCLFAQEQQGVYIIPSISYLEFDNDRNMESDVLPGVGLGYSSASPWAFELHHHVMSTNDKNGQDADFDYTRLDALYRLNNNNGWQPYLVAGIGLGSSRFAKGNNSSEALSNLGVGIAYHFNDFFKVRSDIRILHSEDGYTDGMVSGGLSLVYLWAAKSTTSTKELPPTANPVATNQQSIPTQALLEDTPPLDTDGDGIIDTLDNCPNSSAKAKVDENGCYIVLEETKTFSLNVEFSNNSDVITKDSLTDIAALSQFLSEYPKTKVTIEGHSDSLGKAAYNKDLSQRRAESVKQTLINEYQINEDRIQAMGFGEEKPIASNATQEGRKKNRRVNAIVNTTIKKMATQ